MIEEVSLKEAWKIIRTEKHVVMHFSLKHGSCLFKEGKLYKKIVGEKEDLK